MRKIRFPDLDITGMWVLAVGVFFHLIAGSSENSLSWPFRPGKFWGWVW
jgi:hypothetical protein